MKFHKVLLFFLMIIFIIVFSITASIILKDFQEANENNKSTENLIEKSIIISEETQERSIDWEYLKSINEDIVGWIFIENTNIDYPILKDKETYYLQHSFDKKYNSNGSIFTTNLSPFEDEETLIYGHNMKNGSMFTNLSKYWNEDFFKSHLKFKVYTPECNYEANVFSVYSTGIETENNNIKSLNFKERIKYYKKSSKYDIVIPENISKIIKLSTCSYINARTTPTDQRYYIVCNLTIL